jgi:hypothetical protein
MKLVKSLVTMFILTLSLSANDTIVLNPGSAIIKKDTVVLSLDPPPTLDVKQTPKTNWSRIKDLFL